MPRQQQPQTVLTNRGYFIDGNLTIMRVAYECPKESFGIKHKRHHNQQRSATSRVAAKDMPGSAARNVAEKSNTQGGKILPLLRDIFYLTENIHFNSNIQ